MPRVPHIVVLDDWEGALTRLLPPSLPQLKDGRARLDIHRAPLRGAALVEALQRADAVVLLRDRTPFGAELLEQLPRLRLLMFTGTRNTALDLEAVKARGLPVCHTEWGPSKDATCELTWALILAASRRLAEAQATLRAGRWREEQPEPLPPVLSGRRLGLIGLGEIGGRVAAIGRAFGMEVVSWSPNMTAERATQKGARFVGLEELLSSSDVVSLHLVPSAASRSLLNGERLARMRPGSLLVNTSRAALVDTDALVQALQAGRPGYAAIDVFDMEPLAAAHPLRSLPNALLTPHLGFVCEPVFDAFASGVSQCLAAWLDGRELPRQLG